MKPWEETWEADEDMPDVRNGDALVLRALGDGSEDRAKLAAAAPEMARLLLKHQWDTNNVCPECRGARVDDDDEQPLPGGYGHAKDCGLVSVLRKANVLGLPT